MKFRPILFLFIIVASITAEAQQKSRNIQTPTYPTTIARPKLVVGIVIDQMRWDYLYRYYSRYGNGGFKRLINDGFSVENTFIPYVPTYTACGHTSVYTGSVPAINGIIGNSWYDPEVGRDMYCAEDKSTKTVGSNSKAGEMSPKNMLTTTIGDELRLATNFKSKVIGVALKDRGAILPAGHSANAAYWYDAPNSSWITSTYYMPTLPNWVVDYNSNKTKSFPKDWNTLYPIATYSQSTTDDKTYEGKYKGETTATFPHIGNNAPSGNTMTLDFAKLIIKEEKLGQTGNTDFLAVSCSATDYVGHQFGPNSIEAEDTYLRLDKDLEDFFTNLDKTYGKGNYLLFLTADHGAVGVPGFNAENRLPNGKVSNSSIRKGLDSLMIKTYNLKKSIISVINNQIYFDHNVIESSKVNFEAIKKTAVDFIKNQVGMADAVDLQTLNNATIPEEIKKRLTNGYNARRSGDIYYLFKPSWFDSGATGTSHSTWYPYDSHIPLVFMGWNVRPGKSNQMHYMTDIAATVSAMLHIQMPSGSVGSPITEITH